MSSKPPKKLAALRPTFGVGVIIGVLIILASQASGNDSALGIALGGGTGILLGLSQLARSGGGARQAGEGGGEAGK